MATFHLDDISEDITQEALQGLRNASREAEKSGHTLVVLKGRRLVEMRHGKIIKVLKTFPQRKKIVDPIKRAAS